MSDTRPSLTTRLLPELALFPNEQQRQLALSAARKDVFKKPGRLLTALAWLIGVSVVVGVAAALLQRLFGMRAAWLAGVIAGPAGSVGSIVVGNLIFRVPIQRHLREQLNALNVHVCLHCGYQLKGNTSGRCPECGRDIESA